MKKLMALGGAVLLVALGLSAIASAEGVRERTRPIGVDPLQADERQPLSIARAGGLVATASFITGDVAALTVAQVKLMNSQQRQVQVQALTAADAETNGLRAELSAKEQARQSLRRGIVYQPLTRGDVPLAEVRSQGSVPKLRPAE